MQPLASAPKNAARTIIINQTLFLSKGLKGKCFYVFKIADLLPRNQEEI